MHVSVVCILGTLIVSFHVDTLIASDIDILVRTSNVTSGYKFFSDQNRILPQTQNNYGNLPGISNILHLRNDEFVYLRENKIFRGPLSENVSYSATLLLEFGKISIISVDQLHKNVYFYEETIKMIGVTPFDSSAEDLIYRVIVSQIRKLESFTVDPLNGMIFWVENDSYPCIYVCNLKGEEKRVLHYQGLHEPRSLMINSENKQLYWYDAFLMTITSSSIHGYDRKIIAQLDSDLSIRGFLKADLLLVMNSTTILIWNVKQQTFIQHLNILNIEDVTLIDKQTIAGPCSQLKCSQFCFPRTGGVKCECFNGFTLNLNERDCTRSLGVIDEGLFVAKDERLCYTLTDIAFGNNRTFKCFEDLVNVISVVADEDRNKIIFLRRNNNTWEIGEITLGLWTSSIIFTSEVAIKGFSYDEVEKIIYFGSFDSIIRNNFKDTNVVLKEEHLILSISIDAKNRMMAWVTTHNYFIQIAALDGSGRRTLVSSLGIYNIYISPFIKRLFWTTCGGIMSVDTNGKDVEVNKFSEGGTFESLIHYQNLLIWSFSTSNESYICSTEYEHGVKAIDRCVLLEEKITDMVINDRLLSSEKVSTLCSSNNGECGEVCLKYGNERCGCDFGMILSENNVSCVRDDFIKQFMLLDKSENTVFGFSQDNKYDSLVRAQKDLILDITIGQQSNFLYVAFNDSIVQYSVKDTYNSTTRDITGMQPHLFCLDDITDSLIIIGLSVEGYSLYHKPIDTTRNVTKVHIPDLSSPTEIACITNKRVAVISNGNILVVYSIENSTWNTLQTPYQKAHLRLAVHQIDKEIFCAETKLGEIFRLSLDGKYITKVYVGNDGEITDFDVDDKYVYALAKLQRQILIIRKSDGGIHRRIAISPIIGHISKIILVPVNTEGITVQNTEDKDNGLDSSIFVAIVVPILLIIIAVVLGILVWRKRALIREHAANHLPCFSESMEVNDYRRPP